ncbi:MAG: acyl-CoA dehydrogenase family protein [Acidimicrobiales bacterium]
MKLRYDDSVEEFRVELLDWLAANRPTPEEMAADPSVSTGHAPGWARRWTRAMFDAGWLVPGWPPELGGRSAGPIETLVYLEELAKARIRTTNVQGLGIVAPSIIDYGRPDQVADYAMPILHGEATACLGMSEPDAGSDLASLKTRAVLEGDAETGQWVIDGQKVWTSGANYADFCFLFCRTEPDQPSTRASRSCWCRCRRRGSRCGRCPRSSTPTSPTSTRCSSTRCGCRPPTWSASGATGGPWPTARWPTSAAWCG